MNEQAGRYQGRQFGNYHLLRLIGEGGSAEVYLGKHVFLGTEVAIKILDARLKASEFPQFRQEARTLSTLHHPSIIQIFDLGLQDDLPFLVMSYASQGSLAQRYPPGSRLPLNTIMAYVHPIASALQYAHEQHVVHRDIKPDNLLINSENDILLSDFGIAVATHNTHSLRTQKVIGTVTYMAPEQLRGKARSASDQYALGVVVYEWLCGTPPFDGALIEVAVHHLHDAPQPLRQRVPEIAPVIERVVLKALTTGPLSQYPGIRSCPATGLFWQRRSHCGNIERRAS